MPTVGQLPPFPSAKVDNCVSNDFTPEECQHVLASIEQWQQSIAEIWQSTDSEVVNHQVETTAPSILTSELSIFLILCKYRQIMRSLKQCPVTEFRKIWEHDSKINAQNGYWVGQICNALRVLLDAGCKFTKDGPSVLNLFRMAFTAAICYQKAKKSKKLQDMVTKTMSLAEKYREMAQNDEDDHSYDMETYGYLKCRLNMIQLNFPQNTSDSENIKRILTEISTISSEYGGRYRLRIAENLYNETLDNLKLKSNRNTIGLAFLSALNLAKSVATLEDKENVMGIEYIVISKARIVLALALYHRKSGDVERFQSISNINKVIAELKNLRDDDVVNEPNNGSKEEINEIQDLMVKLIQIRVILYLIPSEQISESLVSEYILDPLNSDILTVDHGLQIVDSCYEQRAKYKEIAVKALDVLYGRFPDNPSVLMRKLNIESDGIADKMKIMTQITKNCTDHPDLWTDSMRRDIADSIWNIVQNLYCKGSGEQSLRFLTHSLRFIQSLSSDAGITMDDFLRVLSCLCLEFGRFEEALKWIETAKEMSTGNGDTGSRLISPEKEINNLLIELKCRFNLNQMDRAKEIFDVIEHHQKFSMEIMMVIAQESVNQKPCPLTLGILEKAMKMHGMQRRNKLEILKQIISGTAASKWNVDHQRIGRYFRESLAILPSSNEHNEQNEEKRDQTDEFVVNDIKFFAHHFWRFIMNDDQKLADSEPSEFIEIGADLFDRIPETHRSDADRKCSKWFSLYRVLLDINAIHGPSENATSVAARCLDGIQSVETMFAAEFASESEKSLNLAKFKCLVILSEVESVKRIISEKLVFSEQQYLSMIDTLFRFEIPDKFEIARLAMDKILKSTSSGSVRMEKSEIYEAMMFRRMMISWNVRVIGTVNEMEQNRPYFQQIVDTLNVNQFTVLGEDEDIHSEWKWFVTRASNHALYYITHSKQRNKEQYIEYLHKALEFLNIANQLEQCGDAPIFTKITMTKIIQKLKELIGQQKERRE